MKIYYVDNGVFWCIKSIIQLKKATVPSTMSTMLFRAFLIVALCTTMLTEAKIPNYSHRKEKPADSRLGQSRFKGSKRARFQLDDECGRPHNITPLFELDNLSPLDVCCDKRNTCKDNIGGYQYSEKFNLHNDDATTRVSCKCEKEFYNCLHGVNTPRANYVGWMYYSQYTNPKCFIFDYPSLGCEKWIKDDFSNPRCKKYEVDKNMPLKYEWRDLPFFDDEFPAFPEYSEPNYSVDEPPVEELQSGEDMDTENADTEDDQLQDYSFKDGLGAYTKKDMRKSRKMKTQHKAQANRSNKSKTTKRKHTQKL